MTGLQFGDYRHAYAGTSTCDSTTHEHEDAAPALDSGFGLHRVLDSSKKPSKTQVWQRTTGRADTRALAPALEADMDMDMEHGGGGGASELCKGVGMGVGVGVGLVDAARRRGRGRDDGVLEGPRHGHGHHDQMSDPSSGMHHFWGRSKDALQGCSDEYNGGFLHASMPKQSSSSNNNNDNNNAKYRKRAVGQQHSCNQSTPDSEIDIHSRPRFTLTTSRDPSEDLALRDPSEDRDSVDVHEEDSKTANLIPRHRKPSRRMQEAVNDHEVSLWFVGSHI
jgi:hypothetical protein